MLHLLLIFQLAAAVVTPMELRALLMTDPAVAPSVQKGEDGTTADILNKVDGGIRVARDLTSFDVLDALDPLDFVDGLTPAQTAYLQAVLAVPSLRLQASDGTATHVLVNLLSLVKDRSDTAQRLGELASRPGSRAERLFGAGVVVTAADVAKALR